MSSPNSLKSELEGQLIREKITAQAEKDFRENAPTTITAVLKGQGDVAGLRRLDAKSRASANAASYFIAEDKAQFGPVVTDPEKILCIGLNYRAPCGRNRQSGSEDAD